MRQTYQGWQELRFLDKKYDLCEQTDTYLAAVWASGEKAKKKEVASRNLSECFCWHVNELECHDSGRHKEHFHVISNDPECLTYIQNVHLGDIPAGL